MALDLLNKMLTFNPDHRATVEECIRHPYFEGLHSPEDEILAPYPFDWASDNFELKKDSL